MDVFFDNDHLFDFFVGKNCRNRAQLFSDPEDWDSDPYDVFGNIKLSSIWPMQDGMKLFYHFDFGDDWYFQITKTKHKEKSPEPNKSYPALIKSVGPNQIQHPDFEEEEY